MFYGHANKAQVLLLVLLYYWLKSGFQMSVESY